MPNHLARRPRPRTSRPRWPGPGRRRRAARPDDALPPRRRPARSRSSSAATSRAPAGRTTAGPAPSAAIPLPAGLRESDRLPEPLFTPSTKAEVGPRREHRLRPRRPRLRRARTTGAMRVAATSRSRSYRFGAAVAEPAGIILADTKFEFGLDPATGELILDRRGPDARLVALLGRRRRTSRAGPQASFDKQFVRDWLETQAWDKTPPGPGAARRRRRRDARPLRRGVRADHRRQLRALPRRGRDRA